MAYRYVKGKEIEICHGRIVERFPDLYAGQKFSKNFMSHHNRKKKVKK